MFGSQNQYRPKSLKRLGFKILSYYVLYWLPALAFLVFITLPFTWQRIVETQTNATLVWDYFKSYAAYQTAPPPRKHEASDPDAVAKAMLVELEKKMLREDEALAWERYPDPIKPESLNYEWQVYGKNSPNIYSPEEIKADYDRVREVVGSFGWAEIYGKNFYRGLDTNQPYVYLQSSLTSTRINKARYSGMLRYLPETFGSGTSGELEAGLCYYEERKPPIPCSTVFIDFVKFISAHPSVPFSAVESSHPFNQLKSDYDKAASAYNEKLSQAQQNRASDTESERDRLQRTVDSYQRYINGTTETIKPPFPKLEGMGINGVLGVLLGICILAGGVELLTKEKYGVFNPSTGDSFQAIGAMSFVFGMLPLSVLFWKDPSFSVGESFAVAFMIYGLPMMLAVLPIAWHIVKDVFGESYIFKRYFRKKGTEKARLGGVGSFIKKDITAFIARSKTAIQKTEHSPVFLGRSMWEHDYKFPSLPRYLGVSDDLHLLTVAGTGAGKSRDLLFSVSLTYNGGLMLFDPKGEHVQMSYERRNAYTKAHIIDPTNVIKRDYPKAVWNPLEEYDVQSPNLYQQLRRLAQSMVIGTGNDRSKDMHFVEVPRILFAGFALHVMTTYPRDKWSLALVFDLMTKGQQNTGAYDPEAFKRVVEELGRNTAHGSLTQDAAFVLHELQGAERSGMMTTLIRSFQWVKYPSISSCINGKSTFSLRNLKLNDETLYMVLPFDTIEDSKRLLRMFYQVGFDLMQEKETPQPKDSKRRVLIVFDEFNLLGHFEAAAQAVTLHRGSSVKCWFICQNLNQIKQHYANEHDFLNGTNKLFFGVDRADEIAMQYILKSLGTTKVMEAGKIVEMPLISVEELDFLLEADSKIALYLPQNGYPLQIERVPFYKIFPEQAGANSFTTEQDAPAFMNMDDMRERDERDWKERLERYYAQQAEQRAQEEARAAQEKAKAEAQETV
jgi:type IV secretion system protein VirD4